MSEPQEEQRGAGLRDAFARLWTPHRMAYIKGEGKGPDCAFCEIPGLEDKDGLVVARGTSCYAVLNLYPYNSGHLMTQGLATAFERGIADHPQEDRKSVV